MSPAYLFSVAAMLRFICDQLGPEDRRHPSLSTHARKARPFFSRGRHLQRFRSAFVSIISDGPRTARCLRPAREGPRLRKHRTS